MCEDYTLVTLRLEIREAGKGARREGQFYIPVINQCGAARAYLCDDGTIRDVKHRGFTVESTYFANRADAMRAVSEFKAHMC